MRRATMSAALAAGLAAAACATAGPRYPAGTEYALPENASSLGRWAEEPEAALSDEFDAMVEARYWGETVPQAVADLEARGFVCFTDRGANAQCSREVWTRACGHAWDVYITAASPSTNPDIASTTGAFSVSCIGD